MNKKILFNNKVLDKYQTKAVLCNKKAYLVVAGAGSGKTLTIMAKIDYLLKNNVKCNKILCLSFTNETVNSLKESLKKININVKVQTFHKLALDIIGNKYSIISNNLLDYIIDEYFIVFIYFDNTYLLLKYVDNLEYVKEVIKSFINQLKALKLDEKYILSLLFNKLIDTDEKIVLVFILKIFLLYEEELNSENKIDFNDMINLAIDKIDKIKRFKYSYIIVDEYQDTSLSKYTLLKKIIDKYNVNLMAVGDDYQSIYSFTGTKMNLFTKFKKTFSNSKIIKMNYTYRNSYDIVEISKRFVLKNKNQITKRLKSNKYVKESITIVYIDNQINALNYIIKDLDNILVLGRNNKDLLDLKDKEYDINIRFLTVHSSKGLEDDYVIILNVIDDILGFPNKIESSNILKYLNDYNQLEEERRLFYVALTRARKKVFIFTIKGKESLFIKELLKEFRYKIKILDLEQKNFK